MGKHRIQVNFADRFGRMVYVREAGYRVQPAGTRHRRVLARCDCGTTREVDLRHLRSGATKSCGCLHSENMAAVGRAHYTHQATGTPLYKRWRGMLRRCSINAEWKKRRQYFDRGISVCKEWRDFESFKAWALSNGYCDSLTIDRIDGDRGYSPENCRWTSMTKQNENKRASYWWHINGSVFPSARAAAMANGVGETTISRWVRARPECWKVSKYDSGGLREHTEGSATCMGA